MEHVMDVRGARGRNGSLLNAGLFMTLVYIAASDIPGLAALLAVQAGIIPRTSHFVVWVVLGFTVASMFLTGAVVIRLTHATREESGLVVRKDEPYLLHAVILGAAASVIRYALSFLPVIGNGFHTFNRHGMPPAAIGHMAMTVAWMTASAFLLFGVIQAYLMRKTSSHVRLVWWDIPLAGIVVLGITMIPELFQFIRHIMGWRPVAVMTVLSGICSGAVTLAASCWFERSRSLAAPVIAYVIYGGLGYLLHHIVRTALQ